MDSLLLDLGFTRYGEAWAIMKAIHEARVRDALPDTLIAVVHDHVYTTGRKGSAANLLKPVLPLYWVERGGDITYHGPGQLVFYFVFKLRVPVGDFVTLMEDAIIDALAAYGIGARHNPSHRGVWVGDRKICSIGIAVSEGVTYHGLALNVDPDLSFFGYINPCGLDSSKITSMKEALNRSVSLNEVKGQVVRSIASTFDVNFKEVKLSDLEGFIDATKYGEPVRLT